MCECGCGEARYLARLPGNEPGLWYMLEVYPGCRDCHNDPGLSVYTLRESDEEWEYAADTPVAEFNDYGQWGRAILDLALLKTRYVEESGDDDDLSEVSFAFTDFIDGGELGRVILQTLWPVTDTAGEEE